MLDAHQLQEVHNTYGDLLNTIAHQEAARSRRLYGFSIVDPGDIIQDVFETLAKQGLTVAKLEELTGPGAVGRWLRSTARLYSVHPQIRGMIGGVNGGGAKARHIAIVDMASEYDEAGESNPWGWLLNSEEFATIDEYEVEQDPVPPIVDLAKRIVLQIISNVNSDHQREALELVYLNGLPANRAAAKAGLKAGAMLKTLQRARKTIGPEAEATLRVYRRALFPGVRDMEGPIAEPTALLELVQGHKPA